jgi:hypothetical protein
MSTITIDLPPDLALRVAHEATERKQQLPEYVAQLVGKHFASDGRRQELGPAGRRAFHETASFEEWDQAFLEWVVGHEDIQAPPIPLEALRRENMYEDRGL